MEISGEIARKELRFKALRLCMMGCCATILTATHRYTLLSSELAYPCLLLGCALLALAAGTFIYSICKTFPDEHATLSPCLKLPELLVKGGYDSTNEPIDFWMRLPNSNNRVLVGTSKRQFQLGKRGLSYAEWHRLVDSLPIEQQAQAPRVAKPFRLTFLFYLILLVACHFLLSGPSEFIFFDFLARGGYGGAIAFEGELYRILSYAWVHASNTHLWTNVFALALLAETLGQSFSNRTLCSVLIITAATGGILGSLGKDFSIIVGASGAIMGLFGFLFAAQRNRDRRLNPLSREPRQKLLYLFLFLEFCLSIKYAWYGGSVHLIGFASGFGMYALLERTKKSTWQSRTEWAIVACGFALFLSWAVHTYHYFQSPKQLVHHATATEDPFQTMLAATALPDLPSATAAEVQYARQRSIELLPASSLFNWPIARADFWLGNKDAALARLRAYSAEESGSEELRELWLAVERDLALQSNLGDPETSLPQGPATAYLMSADATLFARIKLPKRTSAVPNALVSKTPIDWQLIAVAAPIANADADTYGIWPIPKTKFRTVLTANLVEDNNP